jgi:WD40 repeat protein
LIVASVTDKGNFKYRWSPGNEGAKPFSLEQSTAMDAHLRKRRPTVAVNADDRGGLVMRKKSMAVTQDGKFVFSCRHWDNTCILAHFETGRFQAVVLAHCSLITCVALAVEDTKLIVGTDDALVMVYAVSRKSSGGVPETVLDMTLYGHDSAILDLAASEAYDILATVSRDGSCIIYTLSAGTALRRLRSCDRAFELSAEILSECSMRDFVCSAKSIEISSQGDLVIYSESYREQHQDELIPCLHVYTINGSHKASCNLERRLTSVLCGPDGDIIIASNDTGQLLFTQLHTCALFY